MSPDPRLARLHELLADRALVGLSSREQLELERLLAETGTHDDGDYERAAAALELGLGVPAEELPAGLRQSLTAAARDFAALPPPSARPAPASPAPAHTGPARAPRRWPAVTGWLLAAAAAVLAIFAWATRPAPAPELAEQRAALLARAETLRRDWTPTDQAPGAAGDVAWSQELQQGVVRIRGLTANDPTRAQYQLWIFDSTREQPVDGGVFDVQGDELLVPIDAKLRVGTPTLFAVTLEKPGGVVVSDKQRIVLTAQI